MKAIIAVNNLGYIGLGSVLPWWSKEDFKHFKNMTMGGKLLVGWRTAETLPPLPGRSTVVADIINDAASYSDCDWCIGGKKTYERFAPFFTELHISHIDDDTVGDTMFPDLRDLNKDCKIFNYYFKTS